MIDRTIVKLKTKLSHIFGISEPNVFVFNDSDNDIDIAIVIPDEISRITVIESVKDILLEDSILAGRLITVTPIHKSVYDSNSSAFIQNVRSMDIK